jgi:hypothetical protein
MQNRAKSHRRNKVTVRWLPVELIIEIFRAVQKLIKGGEAWGVQVYYNNLRAFALSNKEWTAIAQAELFRTVILENRSKTSRFLEAVRGSEKLREFCRAVTSLTMGRKYYSYETEGLGDDLDEIARYCPNLVDVSCCNVGVRLEYFRASFHLILPEKTWLTIQSAAGNVKKLDKLNLAGGSILPPSTCGAPSQPAVLAVTLLDLDDVTIPSPIDSSSLPLVRSLSLDRQAPLPIQSLLSQLNSLRVSRTSSAGEIRIFIQESTSLTSLSITEYEVTALDDMTMTIIKEKIVEFKVTAVSFGDSPNINLAAILDGSKAMKKVIFDAIKMSAADEVTPRILQTLGVMKAACKKKEFELWKENFKVGNGKVDLDK